MAVDVAVFRVQRGHSMVCSHVRGDVVLGRMPLILWHGPCHSENLRMEARNQHQHSSAFGMMNPHEREGLVVASRRNVLKASLAGLCGLSFPEVLRHRAQASATKAPEERSGNKAVILLWMTGGPSQIDTWDPKPDRPLQNRGPFGVIQTKLPGVLFCEHLPKMASMLDRCTIIRSVDARHSNHEPNRVFQTGHLDAEPRLDPSAEMTPAIGSVVAKYRGANRSGMPPYVAFQTSKSHVAHGGYLGRQYDPFIANRAAELPIYTNVGVDTGRKTQAEFFKLPSGLSHERLQIAPDACWRTSIDYADRSTDPRRST